MESIEQIEQTIRNCIKTIRDLREERDAALGRSADLLYRLQTVEQMGSAPSDGRDLRESDAGPKEDEIPVLQEPYQVDDQFIELKEEILERIEALMQRMDNFHIDDVTNV